MKKQIILAAILVGACTLMAQAQSQPANDPGKTATSIQDKKEVKAGELPEAVKKTLASDSYKGWEIAKAYMVKDVYEVELKKGTDNKVAKFNKEGKEVM